MSDLSKKITELLSKLKTEIMEQLKKVKYE